MSLKPKTMHELLCLLTTAGLIVLALAFAFHADPAATRAAVEAIKPAVGAAPGSP